MENNNGAELPFLDFETVDVMDDESCASDLSDFDVMAAAQQQQKKRRSSMHQHEADFDQSENSFAENVTSVTEGSATTSKPFSTSMIEPENRRGESSRGRDMSKPTRLPVSARFLQSTKSATEKQRQRTEAEAPLKARPASSERKLTIPVAPNLRCVSRSRDRMVSSEEQEMRAVEEAKKTELERRKKNLRSMEYNKAKSNMPVHNVVRSTKPLTIPTTPYNNLSKRNGVKKYSTTYVNKPAERPRTAPTGPRPLTQPEPFILKTDLRGGSTQPPVEAVLTAGEMCRKFEADPRSHRVPRASTHLTEAMSPMLKTKARASSTGRPLPKSQQQQEEQIMEEAKQHQWKAKPIDFRIFHSMGELGVPKVAAKPMTVCEEFTFHYNEDRVAQRKKSIAHCETDAAPMAFKAIPMPDFESSVHATVHHAHKPLTECASPKLSGGRRASSAPPRRQLPHHDEVERSRREKEILESSRSRKPLVLTQPEEFHLTTSDRGKIAEAMLAQRLEEERLQEEKQREFKAHQIQIANVFVPQPSNKELTDFSEFHLQSDDRHALAASKKIREDERRLAEEKEKKLFHARPVPKAVINPEAAFRVQKEEKPTTCPIALHFATDERMRKRRKFERDLARRKKEQGEQQRQLEMERERQEIENLNVLRRKPIEEGGMCFKAAPRPGEKRIVTKKASDEPPTPEIFGLSQNQAVFLEHSLNTFAEGEQSMSVDEGL